ncbi:MAG: flagellar hook-basal body complex protein [Desulfosporosinus sp.]|nr:flagellar hook-basal body complex protein [Desulfosporosinus sp.]
MMRSLYSAVSGLNGFQNKMDVLGNNIANVDTTGFKSSSLAFATALSQVTKGASAPSTATNLGGTNAIQIGLGQTFTTAQNMTEGSAESTGVNTDLALQGPGYFVLNNGSQKVYTRAGGFGKDANGTLEDPATGAKVQGYSWSADESTTPVWSGAGYGDINVKPGAVMPGEISFPVAEEVTPALTVSGLTAVSTTAPTYDTGGPGAGAENFTIDGMTRVPAGTTPASGQYSYDPSTGHITFAAGFDPASTTSTAKMHYVAPADASVTTSTPSSTSNPTSIDISTTNPSVVTVDYPPAPGATVYNGATVPLTKYTLTTAATPGDLQYTVTPTLNGRYQITFGTDGTGTATTTAAPTTAKTPISYDFTNAAHTLSSFTIDQTGVITGVYSNGVDTVDHKIAQIAVATFPNDAGLVNIGSNFLSTSNNSGVATVGAAGQNSLPLMASGELEMSNVNLAQEFTEMIVAQRGFEANSRVITVGDSILNTVVNMKTQ